MDNQIDYKIIPAMKIIANKVDNGYLMEILAELLRSLAELTKQLSKNPLVHAEFIESGIALKSLRFLFF
jgi:hypothetical protein